MMGYHLMLNFRIPYLATSPSDFWRRWHISLSTWLRDYLYVPLGGNRGGTMKTCRNLMITMVLGGLWHGAAWTFVIWGAFHGAILVAYRLASGHRRMGLPTRERTDGPGDASYQRGTRGNVASWAIKVLVMFHLTCLGWLIFRADSFAQLSVFLVQLVQPWHVTTGLPQMTWQLILLATPLVAVWLLEERTKNLNIIPSLSLLPRSLAYAFTLMAILSLGKFGGHEFIYFQF